MTKRTAQATVQNNTSNPMLAVALVHKYSDNYKNRKEWAIIQPGQSASGALEVEYNTGAFTTGRDWWFVTWYSPDMKTMYYSDPQNFQGIINWFENIAPDAISTAAGVAGAALEAKGAGAAGAALTYAAKVTSDSLFNSESTEGFKQHILRTEDQNALTKIVVNNDLSITIESNSGNSSTRTSHAPAKSP